MIDFKGLLARLKERVAPLTDMTAWTLVIVSVLPLLVIDPSMVVTLLQWVVFALALAGVSVLISRVTLRRLKLSDWAELAKEGNVAAGLVILGACIYLSFIFLAMVIWAKA